ncbi:MAG: peptidyl-prolyl cis-trans isomerase [Myxococcales bacterium]|nr:peptidyl-prolyl cis-trans isomerase [Myxococcales bacterium]
MASLRSAWRAALRDPLAQFLIAGAALVLLQRAMPGRHTPPTDEKRIVVDSALEDSAVVSFTRSAGRSPTDVERARLLDDAVDEEILFREAKGMHLDDDDVVVRRRLVQKAEFLVDDVRPVPEPTPADLAAYLAAHAAAYTSPLLVSFEHVFFSRERRGANAERDARRTLDRLAQDPEAAHDGDAFLGGDSFRERSSRDIDGLFGNAAGAAITALPEGLWSGPVTSAYGVHLVRVVLRREPAVAPLDQVRSRVRQALVDERREENRKAARAALRATYVVERRAAPGGGAATQAMNDLRP